MLSRYVGRCAVLVVVVILAGCQTGDRVGERTVINLLDDTSFGNYTRTPGEKAAEPERRERASGTFLAEVNGYDRFVKAQESLERDGWIQKTSQSAFSVIAPVTALAGILFDRVVAHLDNQAKGFEAQWTATTVVDGLYEHWNEPRKVSFANIKEPVTVNGPVMRYLAIEAVRTTAQAPAESGGASRLLLLLVPSKTDPSRMFLIHPFFYGNRSPKASVGGSSSLAVTVTVKITMTVVSEKGVATDVEVANATFEITGYKTTEGGRAEARFWDQPSRDSAGWFAVGPPAAMTVPAGQVPPVVENVKGYSGTARITVVVTERDESDTRQWIEHASKLMSGQKDNVLGTLKEALGETK